MGAFFYLRILADALLSLSSAADTPSGTATTRRPTMDKLSIRNHIYVDGYAYGVRPRITGVTPWEKRLTPSAGSAYQPEPRDAVMSTVVTIDNPVTGYGVDYEVLVCADYEPAQRGGWDDPSWEAHWHSPEAWYYRPGRGWKRLELTARAEAQLMAELDREAEYRRNYRD